MDLLEHSCSKILKIGDIAEFGVRHGITLNHIIKCTDCSRKYFGFDSFKGMPASRYPTGYKKGTLKTIRIPVFDCDSVKIVKGWFKDTLKSGKKYFNKLAMIHMDADIYESTILALNYCHPFIQAGTIIQFDEIHGYKANPRVHEYKAWKEYVTKFDVKYEVVGVVPKGHASFRIISKNN